jgi:hypothetical protein
VGNGSWAGRLVFTAIGEVGNERGEDMTYKTEYKKMNIIYGYKIRVAERRLQTMCSVDQTMSNWYDQTIGS